MRAVMLSVRPEWCEKILNGEKTVEIRKSCPAHGTPFKVYIYCTLAGSDSLFMDVLNRDVAAWNRGGWPEKKGRVIGEFVCDDVRRIGPECCVIREDIEAAIAGSCLTIQQVKDYAGWKSGMNYANLKDLYGWHISNLKIYHDPCSLDKFHRFDFQSMNGTDVCGNDSCEHYVPSGSYMIPPTCAIDGCYLRHPPQSWRYVEEKR